MCNGFFLGYMTTDSNVCSRASLFHKSYYSTRSDLLNLSKLFTYGNGRILTPASFTLSLSSLTKLWKHETRNQSFGFVWGFLLLLLWVGVFLCVCMWILVISQDNILNFLWTLNIKSIFQNLCGKKTCGSAFDKCF